MVTAWPASPVVWCSVCIESRLEFFFLFYRRPPRLPPSPRLAFDESQTGLAEFERAQRPARVSAAATLIVAQPGTAEITRPRCHKHSRLLEPSKGTPGQSFPPRVITLTQMKQYRAEIWSWKKKKKKLVNCVAIFLYIYIFSTAFYTILETLSAGFPLPF